MFSNHCIERYVLPKVIVSLFVLPVCLFLQNSRLSPAENLGKMLMDFAIIYLSTEK
jgi:cytochrome c oxidase assembly factor CtaG